MRLQGRGAMGSRPEIQTRTSGKRWYESKKTDWNYCPRQQDPVYDPGGLGKVQNIASLHYHNVNVCERSKRAPKQWLGKLLVTLVPPAYRGSALYANKPVVPTVFLDLPLFYADLAVVAIGIPIEFIVSLSCLTLLFLSFASAMYIVYVRQKCPWQEEPHNYNVTPRENCRNLEHTMSCTSTIAPSSHWRHLFSDETWGSQGLQSTVINLYLNRIIQDNPISSWQAWNCRSNTFWADCNTDRRPEAGTDVLFWVCYQQAKKLNGKKTMRWGRVRVIWNWACTHPQENQPKLGCPAFLFKTHEAIHKNSHTELKTKLIYMTCSFPAYLVSRRHLWKAFHLSLQDPRQSPLSSCPQEWH